MKGFIYLRSKVSSLFLLTLFLSPQMAASSHGWGKVTMNGEIVDTACAIDRDTLMFTLVKKPNLSPNELIEGQFSSAATIIMSTP